MISDYHMHTVFSEDSEALPEEMIGQAIALGMKRICITDHMDIGFPKDEFWLDTPAYVEKILELQEKYRGYIDVRLGVELGLQKQYAQILANYVRRYPFDFVIGSMHLLHGKDPYEPETFAERTDESVFRDYFEATLENIQAFSDFHVLGHLDYVVRYGMEKAAEYSYAKFADIIDEILKTLIEKGCGLEVNTAGLKYGLGFCNPHPDVLKRYRKLGGEIITIGSDAHKPRHVGYEFAQAEALLRACGFAFRTEFVKNLPEFIKI